MNFQSALPLLQIWHQNLRLNLGGTAINTGSFLNRHLLMQIQPQQENSQVISYHGGEESAPISIGPECGQAQISSTLSTNLRTSFTQQDESVEAASPESQGGLPFFLRGFEPLSKSNEEIEKKEAFDIQPLEDNPQELPGFNFEKTAKKTQELVQFQPSREQIQEEDIREINRAQIKQQKGKRQAHIIRERRPKITKQKMIENNGIFASAKAILRILLSNKKIWLPEQQICRRITTNISNLSVFSQEQEEKIKRIIKSLLKTLCYERIIRKKINSDRVPVFRARKTTGEQLDEFDKIRRLQKQTAETEERIQQKTEDAVSKIKNLIKLVHSNQHTNQEHRQKSPSLKQTPFLILVTRNQQEEKGVKVAREEVGSELTHLVIKSKLSLKKQDFDFTSMDLEEGQRRLESNQNYKSQ